MSTENSWPRKYDYVFAYKLKWDTMSRIKILEEKVKAGEFYDVKIVQAGNFGLVGEIDRAGYDSWSHTP